MKKLINYLSLSSRTCRALWGTSVQRWTLLLASIVAPVLIATGVWTAASEMENDKLVCSLCALGALLSCLPLLMQAKDVAY